MPWVWCLAAISVSTAAAVASFFALRASPAWRAAATSAAGAIIAFSPLLVPAGFPFARFWAALAAVVLMAKLLDLAIHLREHDRPRLPEFLAFLPSIHCVVFRKRNDRQPVDRGSSAAKLGLGLVASSAGLWATRGLFRFDWQSWPFALEHIAKVGVFFLTLMALASTLDRLIGVCRGDVRLLMNRPYLARTPAEFWRRYNLPAQQFFYEDVFKPAGGRHHLLSGIFAAFAASALVHEYLFDIAVGRVQGYQTIFFALHGAAVAATVHVRPQRGLAPLMFLATLAFNLAASVFFFRSVDEVVPFYHLRAS
jgi:hypothetical protein